MSAAWFILLSLAWTGSLAGLAHLLTAGGAGARYAQLVWRGAALLSFAPWAVVGVLAVLPKQFPAALPEIPYVDPVSDAVVSVSSGLRSAVAGPDWGWTATLLMAVLIAGWVVRLVAALAGQARLQTLKSRSVACQSDAPDLSPGRKAAGRVPDIRLIPGGSPFVAGVSKRAIYVPEGLKAPEDLRQVVIHECVHLERGDLVTRPVERLVADVFWFSPFAWMMRRELDFWREAVCDEIASRRSGDAIGYARVLARAARISAPLRALPVSSFILPRKRSLSMRLSRILEPRPSRRRPLLAAGAAILALAAAPFAVGQGDALAASISYSHPVIMDADVKVSSQYGKRKHPIDGKMAMHTGTDIKGATGTPIYSPADGKVGFSGYKDGYGEMIEVIYQDGSKLIYCQLSERLVTTGDTVAPGDKVGLMGASGRATGPHLHIEYWRPVAGEDGKSVMKSFDPETIDGLVLYKN